MIRVKPSQIRAMEKKFNVDFNEWQKQRDSDQWPQAYWDFHDYLVKHYSVEDTIAMSSFAADGRPVMIQPIMIDDLAEPYESA
jgi:hypothetical protein